MPPWTIQVRGKSPSISLPGERQMVFCLRKFIICVYIVLLVKMKTRLALSLVVASALIVAVIVAVDSMTIRYVPIPSTASVKAVGVGIYWDIELAQPVTSINWGTIEPGENVNRSIYIQNVGNVPITIGLMTQNWNPPEASCITLAWNYTGQLINVNEAIPVTLTLSVPLEVTGFTNFSFDIIISAMG